MIWTARADTTLDYLNTTCVEFTGLPLDRLLDNGWLDAVHPDDIEGCVATYTPAIEARRPVRVEYRLRRADGAYRWVVDSGVPSYAANGDFQGYVGACLDITERKDAEDRVRESRAALEASHDEIQYLAGRLIEAQDAERTRIARDLHDDVSQQLAGVSIGLSRLRRRMEALGAADELQADLRHLHDTATTLAQSVRHLSHDLHPTVLQHAGLEVALSTHCAELERLHGTAFSCEVAGDVQSMDEASALCLYRIAQEALRNVVAHAAARRAEVCLTRANGHAELVVTDDGAGFRTNGSFARMGGLGLVSIAERVRLAGGTLAINSAPGSGTAVRASIPLSTGQA
jgi:PAS domain S-box-containing protein